MNEGAALYGAWRHLSFYHVLSIKSKRPLRLEVIMAVTLKVIFYSTTAKIEAVCSSQDSVQFFNIIWHHIPKYSNLHIPFSAPNTQYTLNLYSSEF
jgi:hypothetical protein